MHTINSIALPLLFITVFGLFAYVYFKSRVLLEIEKNLDPIFKSRCVSYLDGFRHRFTRFAIYEDFIVVSSRKKIMLKINEIKNVSIEKVYWHKSLDIKHNKQNTPQISLLLNDIKTPLNILKEKMLITSASTRNGR